jgi:hypothetical protein
MLFMKKKCFSLLIGVAVLLSVGCAPVNRGNTLQSREFAPSAHSTTLADLQVASQKIMGRAEGLPQNKRELEQQAIANALATVNGDVLVGANFFYETTGTRAAGNHSMTVIVIGYPAIYRNFRAPTTEDAWLFRASRDTTAVQIVNSNSASAPRTTAPRTTNTFPTIREAAE